MEGNPFRRCSEVNKIVNAGSFVGEGQRLVALFVCTRIVSFSLHFFDTLPLVLSLFSAYFNIRISNWIVNQFPIYLH
jgi:hypothetical protein